MTTLLQELISAGLLVDSATEGGQVSYSFQMTSQQTQTFQDVLLNHFDPASYAIVTHNRATEASAATSAAAIPNWATWTEAQVLAWFTTNIDTPLAVPIPTGTLTVAQIKTILQNMQTIMLSMAVVEKNLSRMEVALRNKTFPNLQV